MTTAILSLRLQGRGSAETAISLWPKSSQASQMRVPFREAVCFWAMLERG